VDLPVISAVAVKIDQIGARALARLACKITYQTPEKGMEFEGESPDQSQPQKDDRPTQKCSK